MASDDASVPEVCKKDAAESARHNAWSGWTDGSAWLGLIPLVGPIFQAAKERKDGGPNDGSADIATLRGDIREENDSLLRELTHSQADFAKDLLTSTRLLRLSIDSQIKGAVEPLTEAICLIAIHLIFAGIVLGFVVTHYS